MTIVLATEIYWLTLTLLMTSLLWVPYIINRMVEQGVFTALWDPLGHTEARAPWANRMMRAHENAIENMVVFAALVLILKLTGLSTTITEYASILYFFARVGHVIVFVLAMPLLRVVTFLLGFSAQLLMALTILQLI